MKKLSHSSNQGKKEFMNEAKLLARVQHRNIVNLLGYCVHGVEKLLVYEYVSHESLDKLLFSKFSVTLYYFPVVTFIPLPLFSFPYTHLLADLYLAIELITMKIVICLGSKFIVIQLL